MNAFMLEVITEKVELSEKRCLFVEDALKAEREMKASGLAYDAKDVHQYLRERARGSLNGHSPNPGASKAWPATC